jgi:hypothetical protein
MKLFQSSLQHRDRDEWNLAINSVKLDNWESQYLLIIISSLDTPLPIKLSNTLNARKVAFDAALLLVQLEERISISLVQSESDRIRRSLDAKELLE